MPEANHSSRPRLAPGVRLHFDAVRQAWVLLAPERVIETEGPVHDIVSRCDGSRSVQQIAAELAAVYTAPMEEIAADIGELLQELAAKRLILL